MRAVFRFPRPGYVWNRACPVWSQCTVGSILYCWSSSTGYARARGARTTAPSLIPVGRQKRGRYRRGVSPLPRRWRHPLSAAPTSGCWPNSLRTVIRGRRAKWADHCCRRLLELPLSGDAPLRRPGRFRFEPGAGRTADLGTHVAPSDGLASTAYRDHTGGVAGFVELCRWKARSRILWAFFPVSGFVRDLCRKSNTAIPNRVCELTGSLSVSPKNRRMALVSDDPA